MRFWRPRSDWALAAAAMVCCGWGGNQFTPLLAMYRNHNHFSEVVVDALLGAYVLGLAPALLAGGGLSDRHGRRPLMIGALIATIAGSVALSTDTLTGLAIGRLCSGAGIGLAMAVGTTWVVELRDADTSAATAARRGSLSLTAGLGAGPLAAGLLAQYGPLPTALPYWVHVAVTAPVLVLLLHPVSEFRDIPVRGISEAAPATATAGITPRPMLPPVVATDRFRRLILPLAPWIFGAAGIAYATVPEAVDAHVAGWSLLYATLLTVTAMTASFLIQPIAQRLDHPVTPRAGALALGSVTAGMALAAITVSTQQPWLGVVTAAVLGAALGMAMVAGLLEIQRLTPAADLARATGIFYALAYVGFLAPVLIALSGQTTTAIWILTAAAAICGLRVSSVPLLPGHHGPRVRRHVDVLPELAGAERQ